MYNKNMASTSRLTTEEPWEDPKKSWSFPMSDLRSVDLDLSRSTAPPVIPFESQSLTPLKEGSIMYLSSSKYSFTVSPRIQIDIGVWSSGTDRVLSASCPDVQAFLTCARDEMVLPAAPSEVIFCLAALSVFYRVEDPIHWMFWSDEKKYQTAEVVDRIALHRPQLIMSPVAWNGTREYLFILSGLHGATSAPLFEKKWWYPILNPSKAPSPPRILNLRKRKPQQAEPRDPLGDLLDDIESIDIDEPPPKRSRPRRLSNSSPPNKTASSSQDTQITPEISTSPTTVSVPLPKLIGVDHAPNFGGDSQGVLCPESEKVEPVRETRPRKRKAHRRSPLPSLTSDSSDSRASSPPSMLLTPPSLSHSRNRSTSQASLQTVVPEARDRRSVSVLSAITAVEIVTIKKDSLLDAKDDHHVSDSEDEEEKEEGMITRGRANKARSFEPNVAPPAKRPSRKRGTRRSRAK